jgi:hypothetical protein
VPFFGELGVSQVTPGKVQEYRVHRATTAPVDRLPTRKQPARATASSEIIPSEIVVPAKHKAPARSTLHDEVVTLRQVLNPCLAPTKIKPLLSISCAACAARVALQSRHIGFRP